MADLKKLDNKEFIPWADAVEHMKDYLATSHFKSKVLQVGPEVFGKASERTDIHKTGGTSAVAAKELVYEFIDVKFEVEKASGRIMNMAFAFRFNWTGDQWRIIQTPGIMS